MELLSSLVLVSTSERSFCLSHSLEKTEFQSKSRGFRVGSNYGDFHKFRLGGFLRTFFCHRGHVPETKTEKNLYCNLFKVDPLFLVKCLDYYY